MDATLLSIPLWTPGVGEIVVIAVVVLVLFGTKKIPQLGKGLGEGIRNFKHGLKDGENADKANDKASRKELAEDSASGDKTPPTDTTP